MLQKFSSSVSLSFPGTHYNHYRGMLQSLACKSSHANCLTTPSTVARAQNMNGKQGQPLGICNKMEPHAVMDDTKSGSSGREQAPNYKLVLCSGMSPRVTVEISVDDSCL
ncbi:hypothetical protein M758_12G029900 [Ceratodon purpureus]|uniref:Uncharacterized protein n=1 Tax=Ceratodon purpureus TaxID=3225 RepID=A0A8T0G375_CERPU|nr:hypothetical protein KC19_12G030200 [Ceratodon purpureus]KAG0597909.1 hypothetical protein M758_12G029900 [Ceratodon purpureus]